jgi:phosphatidyl-myo-inositol alpha-mannosyltransferase
MKKTSQKLRVGFLFDDTLDSSAGVPQYVKTLGAWLSKQGHEVAYLVGETKIKTWDGAPVYSLARNQKVVFNGNHLSIPLPANNRKIKQVLTEHQFDILHVQMPHSPFMSQKVINRAPPSTAIVGTFHVYPAGFLARFGSRLLRLLYGRGLKRIEQVLGVSPAAADFAKKSFGLNIRISSNLIDLAQIRTQAAGQQPEPGHIVFLGRLVKRKGVMELLQAFSILRQNLPNARLTIAGQGPLLKKLKGVVGSVGLENSVKFAESVNDEQKSKLFASAQIACFPSLYGESFGIVLIEAMAAGSQVVLGGRNPGYESVLGEQPALMVEPQETEAFASHLARLLRDQPLRRELNNWQLNKVKNYDVNRVGSEVETLYRQLIAKKQLKRHN